MAPSRGRRPAEAPNPSKKPAARTPDAQPLLDVFRTAFPKQLDPNQVESVFNPLLQEVKGHLFRRDFVAAFSRPEYLEVYACRWSAARAVGYLNIFTGAWQYVRECAADDPSPPSVACLGGGAGAELVALLAMGRPLNISCVDSADWSSVVSQLSQASAQLREKRASTLSSRSTFCKLDLLSHDEADQTILNGLYQSSSLITIMFTLNELYSTSMAATQGLLLSLTAHATAGTVLLVVDSPGSYSTVLIGGREKKYPMAWLLDYTLLKLASEVDQPPQVPPEGRSASSVMGQLPAKPPWQKVDSDESRWFRLPDGLRFPIALENMRYQIHIYRRN